MNLLITTATLIFLGQTAAAKSVSAAKVNSILDFMTKGGPMMVPIGIGSLVAMAVVIERLFSLRRRSIIPAAFVPGLRKAMGDNGDDRKAALAYCQSNGSPIANILSAGIRRMGESAERVEKHVQDAGEREVLKLRKNLRTLSVIASIAPLMGLLGTIFGMILAFQTVATSGEALGKAELLAKGIYQAMITTAAGLSLAIPVVVAYHYFSSKIERLVLEMDQLTVEFLEDFAYPSQSASETGPKLVTPQGDNGASCHPTDSVTEPSQSVSSRASV